jgi:putative ABC transport system permease protein
MVMPDPLWRRSPLALRRHPGVLLAIAFGAALLALAVAAYPLFLSSTSTELVASRVSDPGMTRYGAGILYSQPSLRLPSSPDSSQPLLERIDGLFRRTTPFLGPTIMGAEGPAVSVTTPGHRMMAPGRLFTATGATDHIQVVSGHEGDGVWIPDTIAAAVHARPGGTITLTSPVGSSLQLPVDGIYRAIFTLPRTGYWRAWEHDVYLDCPTFPDCPTPPQFLITDMSGFLAASHALGTNQAAFTWVAPVPPGPVTLDQARSIAASVDAFHRRISDRHDKYRGTVFSSGTAQVVKDVEERITQLQGPGQLLSGAGVLVALIVIGVAGSFSFAARRVENALLLARGARVGTVAAKAALEHVLPTVTGAGIGLVSADALVALFGPGGDIGATARARAEWGTLAVAFAALVSVCAVAVLSYLRQSERHRGRTRLLQRAPWEIVPGVLAYVALSHLRTDGAVLIDPMTQVLRPSPYLLAFPVLFLVGFAALAARAAAFGVRRLRDRSGRFAPSSYLALHRLAGTAALTTSLIAASALCFGLFVHAQTLVGSLRTTVEAKAKVFVGSDVEGRVSFDTPAPANPPYPFTRVSRLSDAGTLPNGPDVDWLTINPATFTSAAYWNASFSDESLAALVGSLRSPGGAIPVILAGGDGLADPTSVDIAGTSMPVRVVGHAVAFPGMESTRPLLVVDESRFVAAYPGPLNPLATGQATTEFWIRGQAPQASRYLASLRYAPYLILTAAQVEDIPSIVAVIDTFAVLNLLGLAAGLLVVAGVLVYLQARRRSQLVSYGLSLRMGMTNAAHRRSLVIELMTILGSSYVIGVAAGITVSSLMVPLLDPLATIHPAPLFVVPATGLLVTTLVVMLLSWIGGWYTNLRERSMDLGEVMRLAG